MDIRMVIEQLEVYKVKKRKECCINCMFYTSNSTFCPFTFRKESGYP